MHKNPKTRGEIFSLLALLTAVISSMVIVGGRTAGGYFYSLANDKMNKNNYVITLENHSKKNATFYLSKGDNDLVEVKVPSDESVSVGNLSQIKNNLSRGDDLSLYVIADEVRYNCNSKEVEKKSEFIFRENQNGCGCY
jgi:hypothetical protein